MALQKRRIGKPRTRQRRSQWMRSFAKSLAGKCPNCGEPRLPHRVCMKCGHYRGEQVVEVSEEETE